MKKTLFFLLCSASIWGCGSGSQNVPAGAGGAAGAGASGGFAGSSGTAGANDSGAAGAAGNGGASGSGNPVDAGKDAGAGWHAPTCATISGTGAVTFTHDRGATLAPTAVGLSGIGYAAGLVALPNVPDTLEAHFQGQFLRSTDAGCTWKVIGSSSSALVFKMKAAPGDRVYAWTDNGAGLVRIDASTVTTLTAPDQHLLGLATFSNDPAHARVSGKNGQLYDTTNAGKSWTAHGTLPPGGGGGPGVFTAFSPINPDRAIFGGVLRGVWLTINGGQSWTLVHPFQADGNAYAAKFSPVDPKVAWLETNSPTKEVLLSQDGGQSFKAVLPANAVAKDQNGVERSLTLTNGPTLAADPNDANSVYVVFGASFQNYGTDLFRYDHATDALTVTHNAYDGIDAISFSPADPSWMYLGLVSD